MKYLQDTFKAELSDDSNTRVEDGIVYIRSRYWSAVDILELARTADGRNDVFDELFDEWFNERVENKCIEAKEILDKLDQQDRFLRLIEGYKDGNVMPFVGADGGDLGLRGGVVAGGAVARGGVVRGAVG